MKRAALAVVLTVSFAPAAAPARAVEPFQCGPKDVHGVAADDAETAAALVCGALRRESGGAGRFEVSLGTLGSAIILTVERREPSGSVSARLERLEEIEVAAPRLARALVRGEAFTSTQRVDNLLESETRSAPVKHGAVRFAASVADVETPGLGARATGFSLGLQYVTPRFALPVDLRFGLDEDRYPAARASLFAVSLGGRYFFSTRDTSPFAGAGMGLLWLDASEGAFPESAAGNAGYFAADTLQVAPYLEVGVEALRLHRGRVGLFVRVDLPLSTLKSPETRYYEWDAAADGPGSERVVPGGTRYVAPVSIGVHVSF
jgi:opacity protein-like surface antigen